MCVPLRLHYHSLWHFVETKEKRFKALQKSSKSICYEIAVVKIQIIQSKPIHGSAKNERKGYNKKIVDHESKKKKTNT